MSSSHGTAPTRPPDSRRTARGIALRVTAAAALAVAASLAVASLAQAAYVSSGPFATPDASPAPGVVGIAVNQATGEVFGADPLNNASSIPGNGILRFDAAGTALTESFPSATNYSGVAIDPTATPLDGDVYGLNYAAPGTLSAFSATGTLLAGPFTVGGFPNPAAQIATDASGNVYYPSPAADNVQKYNAAGVLQGTIDGTGDANLFDPFSVAVDVAGNVYVVDRGPNSASAARGRLLKFDSTGAFVAVIDSGAIGGIVRSVAINRTTGQVFVGKGTTTTYHVVVYDSAGSPTGDDFGLGLFSSTAAVPTTSPQIAINETTGKVYVSDPAGLQIETFVPGPGATTSSATGVTLTGATLNGSVDPEGETITSCQFEYGLTTGYGQTAPCQPAAPSGTSWTPVSASVSGLDPNATYNFRISITTPSGTFNGQNLTFQTVDPPAVVTTPASSIGQTGATLNATVDPNGGTIASCQFQYGTTTAYGQTAACVPAAPTGTDPVPVSASVSGLTPNTGYHYRVVVNGSIQGDDAGFETLDPTPVATTTAATAVGLTGATLNGTVDPEGGTITDCQIQYGPTAAYGQTAQCTPSSPAGTDPVAVSAAVTGLDQGSTYHFRVVAASNGGTDEGDDLTFTTESPLPVVDTTAATSVGQTAATLNGTVDPNGNTLSSCEFQYGTTTGYGQTAPCDPATPSGADEVPVSAAISGLTARTTYHYRVVVNGTIEGDDMTFETLDPTPVAETAPATAIGSDNALLHGSVDPNGGTITSCRFEYGTTTSYGQTAPCSPSSPSGDDPVAVSASVSGLTPNTTYHFRVVASTNGGTGEGDDAELHTVALPPSADTTAATDVAQTGATLNATVDPNGGTIASCQFQYGTTTSYGQTAPCTPSNPSGGDPVDVSGAVTGLTANTTYHYRVVVNGTIEGDDVAFETLDPTPVSTTGAATDVTSGTATLHGTVDPDGGTIVSCRFEYGPTPAYGQTIPCDPSSPSGSEPVAVSADVSALAPDSDHHFRLVATSNGGTGTGSDAQFRTPVVPPVPDTGDATAVSQTGATLHGTVDPNGGPITSCQFQYGTTTSYGQVAPCDPAAPSGNDPVDVSAAISGLSASTTYHYRLRVNGTVDGDDATLRTLDPAPVAETLAAVSVDHDGATLRGTVDPKGGSITDCRFHYGPTTAYGQTASCTPSPPSGASVTTVSAAVTGLEPSTTYHFKVVASSNGGSDESADRSLTTTSAPTLPGVATGAGSDVGQTRATLTGVVDPNGHRVVDCRFEYGTTTAYGKVASCSPDDLGAGTEPTAVTASVAGLEPSTTYHFRLRATNAAGTAPGASRSFATSAAIVALDDPAPPACLPDCTPLPVDSPAATSPAPTLSKLARRAAVRRGVARVRVTCPSGGAPCKGRVKLTARIGGPKGKRSVTIGRSSYVLRAGKALTLRIRLSKAALKALARTGRLRAVATGPDLERTGLTLATARKNRRAAAGTAALTSARR